MSPILADPVEMIRQGTPRLIHSEDELAEYTRALFTLTSKPKPTAQDQEAINLLNLLIEQYETVRYPVPKARGVEALRQLLKWNGLSQSKVALEMGCVANVSLVMRGDRKFTRSHIARLSKRFKVPPDVFFDAAAAIPERRRMNKKSVRAKAR